MKIPRRTLGKTGEQVTLFGLGGEGVLRTYGREEEAYRLINEALDLGVNYCESARAYSGSEGYYGRALRERRSEIFLTSKSHGRKKEIALSHLRQTLRNMQTDHLDLWQVHDVRTDQDVDEIFGPGGAIEAFVQAKREGHVRYLGVTGHEDPEIIRKCLTLFDFDTVLIPVNAAEPHNRSFIGRVIPLAKEKQMGIIGMKVYFRGLASQLPFYHSMKPFFDFAVSQPVSTVVIGCDNPEQLRTNVEFAREFRQMPSDEQRLLVEALAPYARRLMMYKP